jgi:hypothetical protein
MGVGFVLNDEAYEIGSASFLHGFFSTISSYLEPNGWGTKYPELMRDLYQGKLDARNGERVLKDIEDIRRQLRSIKPPKIVWDRANPDTTAPWDADAVPPDRDLSNCFITSGGEDLFDLLVKCLEQLIQTGGQLTIESY